MEIGVGKGKGVGEGGEGVGKGSRVWVKEVQRKERVQADFMRIVMSQLLGNARLANWKQCVREGQEVAEVRGEVVAALRTIGVIGEL